MKQSSSNEAKTNRSRDLELERMKVKVASLEEQNEFLKNRVKQCNNNLDTLIGQLKFKENTFEESKKVYEAEILLLKKSLKNEVSCGHLEGSLGLERVFEAWNGVF